MCPYETRSLHKGKIVFGPLNLSRTELRAFAFLQWAGQTSAGAEGGGWGTEGEGCLLATGFLHKYLLSQIFFLTPTTLL